MKHEVIRQIIPVEYITIEEAKEDYLDPFFTFQQVFGMSEEYAAKAVSITIGVCPNCYEAPHGCKCAIW